ncbi:MAG: photosynthetic complex assembly protein PuhC [Myxococcota bacterium]
MAHHDDIIVPKPALIATGVLMLASMVIAGTARSANLEAAAREPLPPPETALYLTFGEQEDGTLQVERSDGTTLIVPPASQGFVGGVLRTFRRVRERAQKDVNAPLALGLYRSGALVLSDPETGERIELDSFGPTNRRAFAQLFDGPGQRSAPGPAAEATR